VILGIFLAITLLSSSLVAEERSFHCSEDGFFPDPEDCRKYYICSDGLVIPNDCPGDLIFDINIGRCNIPSIAICQTSSSSSPTTPTPTPTPTTQSPTPTPIPTTQSSTPSPTPTPTTQSTTPTPIPTTQSPTPSPTPTPTTQSTTPTPIPTTQSPTPTSTPTSTTSSSTTSTTSSPIGDCKEEGELLPNPSDCSSFFQCVEGSKVELHCPPGLEFNAEAKVCDYPSAANCSV